MAVPTADDVGKWMAAELEKGDLFQQQVVYDIEKKFGPDFVYTNKNGNLAIKPEVLAAFKKANPDAVWSKRHRYWRKRQEGDEPGRGQY